MRCIRQNRRWNLLKKLPEPRGPRAAESYDLPDRRHYLAPSDNGSINTDFTSAECQRSAYAHVM